MVYGLEWRAAENECQRIQRKAAENCQRRRGVGNSRARIPLDPATAFIKPSRRWNAESGQGRKFGPMITPEKYHNGRSAKRPSRRFWPGLCCKAEFRLKNHSFANKKSQGFGLG